MARCRAHRYSSRISPVANRALGVARDDFPIMTPVASMRRIDFYTVAGPLAFIVGFVWVYLAMVFLKIPGWPAMVGMAAYYAVGGLACHERHDNASKSIKGLLLGAVASWLGVFLWATFYKGSPVAMGAVMGIVAMICVLITKWRFFGDYQFIAMPQAFLGATIYFGLLNTFMIAKGVPDGVLFGWAQSLVVKGGAQPNVAGVLAVFSVVAGVLLGFIHQHLSLYIVRIIKPTGGTPDDAKLDATESR